MESERVYFLKEKIKSALVGELTHDRIRALMINLAEIYNSYSNLSIEENGKAVKKHFIKISKLLEKAEENE